MTRLATLAGLGTALAGLGLTAVAWSWQEDTGDGVQHDTFWSPSPGELEAAEIRAACAAADKGEADAR